MDSVINLLADKKAYVKVDVDKLEEFIEELKLYGYRFNGDVWLQRDGVYIYLTGRKIRSLTFTEVASDSFKGLDVFELWQDAMGYYLRKRVTYSPGVTVIK